MQEHFKSDSDTDIKLKTFYVGRIYPMIKIWQKLFVICNGIIQAWQLAISLMRTHKFPKLSRDPYMQLIAVEPFGWKVGLLARDLLLAFWQVHTAHVFLNICRDAIASAAIADDWKRIDRPDFCFQCGGKTSLQKSRGFVPMVCSKKPRLQITIIGDIFRQPRKASIKRNFSDKSKWGQMLKKDMYWNIAYGRKE